MYTAGYTLHTAVTLPNKRQEKYHRVTEIPGGSSSNFSTHYLRTNLGWMKRYRNTVVECWGFLPLPLHLVQINMHIILLVHPIGAARLQAQRTIKDDSLWPKGSFRKTAVQMFVLPETSRYKPYKRF